MLDSWLIYTDIKQNNERSLNVNFTQNASYKIKAFNITQGKRAGGTSVVIALTRASSLCIVHRAFYISESIKKLAIPCTTTPTYICTNARKPSSH